MRLPQIEAANQHYIVQVLGISRTCPSEEPEIKTLSSRERNKQEMVWVGGREPHRTMGRSMELQECLDAGKRCPHCI